MRTGPRSDSTWRPAKAMLWLVVLLAGPAGLGREAARGQEPPPPPPEAVEAPADVPTPGREAELEARVRQLEALVDELSSRLERVETPPPPEPAAPESGAAAGPATSPGPASPSDENIPAEVGGSAASRGPSTPPASSRFEMPAPQPNLGMKAFFGNGFALSTEDDEFQFQFHNLTQVDYRGYWPTPREPLNTLYHSTFGIPRQWWIFSGRLGKPFEYYLVPAFGFDGVNLLDVFLNVRFDDRFQLKVGRFKTPFTYEFYNGPINGLINPERSIFFNNFALNRDIGMMLWGSLLEKRFDYAVGLFNGQRNFYIDRNSSPNLAAYINFRPFGLAEGSPLENFNVGGSVMAGNELNAPVPAILRTNVATTGSSFFGVPFLAFNPNVIESGPRVFWDLHAAWYYRSLSLIAEWASGFQDYALSATPALRTHLPVSGYYAQAGWFATGERVAGRGQVRPIRDFDLRPGKFGPGAVELAGRYSVVHLDRQVFTDGLADPALWSNYAQLIDVGVNWYWTQYIKLYLGWQHTIFGSPVVIDPGRFQISNNMLWARFQISF